MWVRLLIKRRNRKKLNRLNFSNFYANVQAIKDDSPLSCSITEYAAKMFEHSADCEKVFSQMNLIKTETRNHLITEKPRKLLDNDVVCNLLLF